MTMRNLTVRLDDSDRARLEDAAKHAGMGLAAYVRRVLLSRAVEEADKRIAGLAANLAELSERVEALERER